MDTHRRVVISSPEPPDRDPVSGPRSRRTPLLKRLLVAFWLRWSRNPLGTVFFFLLLLWNSSRFPVGDTCWPSDAPGSGPNPTITVCVDRVPISDQFPAGVAIRPATQGGDSGLGLVFYDYRRRGALEGHYVSILTLTLTEAERKDAIRQYLAWLGTHNDRYWRSVAANIDPSGTPSTTRFYAQVIWRSLLTLLIGAFLIRSLAWTLPILSAIAAALQSVHVDPEERLRQKRRRLLAAGLCPKCKYNIIGLPDRRCPECNETWGRHELD